MPKITLNTQPDNPNLVSLRKGSVATSTVQRIQLGPVADKFFFVGTLCGYIGMAYFGVHMWLMQTGQMQMTPHFPMFRALHVDLQLFGFLGLFVIGFSVQAAGKMLSAPGEASLPVLLLIPVLLAGVALKATTVGALLGASCIGLCFGYVFARIAVLSLRHREVNSERRYARAWLLAGVAAFAALPFVNFYSVLTLQVLLWQAMFPIVVVSVEQFVAGFLGGKRYSLSAWRRLSVLLLLSSFVAFLGLNTETQLLKLWGLLNFLALAQVAAAVGSWNVLKNIRQPLGFGVVAALGWSFVSTAMTARFGAAAASLANHAFAIGSLATLIIVVSQHVLSFMATKTLARPNTLLGMLVIWQLVPLGRSLGPVLQFPAWSSLVVASAASIVLTYHVVLILRGEWLVLRRAFHGPR